MRNRRAEDSSFWVKENSYSITEQLTNSAGRRFSTSLPIRWMKPFDQHLEFTCRIFLYVNHFYELCVQLLFYLIALGADGRGWALWSGPKAFFNKESWKDEWVLLWWGNFISCIKPVQPSLIRPITMGTFIGIFRCKAAASEILNTWSHSFPMVVCFSQLVLCLDNVSSQFNQQLISLLRPCQLIYFLNLKRKCSPFKSKGMAFSSMPIQLQTIPLCFQHNVHLYHDWISLFQCLPPCMVLHGIISWVRFFVISSN